MTTVGVGEALIMLEVEDLSVLAALRVDVVVFSVLVVFKEVDDLSEDEDLREGFCELVVFLEEAEVEGWSVVEDLRGVLEEAEVLKEGFMEDFREEVSGLGVVVTLASVEKTDGVLDVLVFARVVSIDDFAEALAELDDILDVVKEEKFVLFVEVASVVLPTEIFDEVGAV